MAQSGLITALICSGMFLTTLHCSNWCISRYCKFHVVFLVYTSIPHLSHNVLLDHGSEDLVKNLRGSATIMKSVLRSLEG